MTPPPHSRRSAVVIPLEARVDRIEQRLDQHAESIGELQRGQGEIMREVSATRRISQTTLDEVQRLRADGDRRYHRMLDQCDARHGTGLFARWRRRSDPVELAPALAEDEGEITQQMDRPQLVTRTKVAEHTARQAQHIAGSRTVQLIISAVIAVAAAAAAVAQAWPH